MVSCIKKQVKIILAVKIISFLSNEQISFELVTLVFILTDTQFQVMIQYNRWIDLEFNFYWEIINGVLDLIYLETIDIVSHQLNGL